MNSCNVGNCLQLKIAKNSVSGLLSKPNPFEIEAKKIEF